MAKRLFDLLFSGGALLLLCPLLLLIAAWVKLGSDGPVFFRQIRVGLHGRLFSIYKFRTMYMDAERRGLQITVGTDPRITSQGHFLRKYKLDELPQLINVLLGHMSIVGPRPEVPRYMDEYAPEVRAKILSVRPGITDRASIEFKDENMILACSTDPHQTYIEEILPIKQKYYLKYVSHHTLTDDLTIIFHTAKAIITRRP